MTLRSSTAAALVLLMVFAGSAVLGQPDPAAAPPATRPAGESDVPVKEVVLFSSGVGYFEHAGRVTGNGSTVLRFKTDQINDILKSLLLEDLDGGHVGTVTYPSQAPLAKTLKSFEVDITSNPPLPELLNQLRGARLSVITNKGPIDGTILGVEKKQKQVNDKEAIDVYVLNLRSGRTIRPIPLDDVQSIEMDDAKLNAELDAALAAVAQARDMDKKPVEIHFNGQGERRVRLGYVVETPVWKTSYRLVLEKPKGAANGKPQPGGAKLQGWAIVENQTDNDWTDVQLSLVSGRPISFIEDLYHSLYIPRPFVQPQLYASLMPQTYQNGITKEDMDRLRQQAAENNANQQQMAQNRPAAGAVTGGVSNTLFAGGQNAGPATPIDPTLSVVSAASASGLGELFQYTVGNVTIGRQQSAMIPIVTDEIDATKVSIYNQNVLADHPLNGVRFKNTTRKHLLQGPVTVIEARSYAGDAQIDDVPPGQQRLLSYGIDLKVLVERNDEPVANTIQSAKLNKGVLELAWKDVTQTEYLIKNRGEADKTIVVEYPREEGWKLDEPAAADETTPSVYRFDRPVAAGKLIKMPIRIESTREERVELLPLDPGKLELYLKLDHVPAKVHDALAQVIDAKQAMAATERQIAEKTKQIADVTAEQSRIRENMKAVSQSTDYYNRLVKKLDEQETQIEGWQKELDGLRKQAESQRKDLESKVGKLTIG
ncbi:MAG TPA: hypothetical protein VGI81_20665 [Tepidisphaeraceae bacterium]